MKKYLETKYGLGHPDPIVRGKEFRLFLKQIKATKEEAEELLKKENPSWSEDRIDRWIKASGLYKGE